MKTANFRPTWLWSTTTRARTRRGAPSQCAAEASRGGVSWWLGGLATDPFARPAPYPLAGRGTQQLGGASSGSACGRWWYPAAPDNRRILRAAPSPRHPASTRRMRVPARHCTPRFPSIDGLEAKIGRVHIYFLRGHSQLRGQKCTIFWPPPCVDSFYNLSVDKNKHFWPPSPPLILST